MENKKNETSAAQATDKALQPEPINCYGATEWANLTALRNGMFNNLSQSIIDDMNGYLSGKLLTREQMEKNAVFNAISEMTQYRERYLIRRIQQLERALGLHTNDDPDDLSSAYYAGNINK